MAPAASTNGVDGNIVLTGPDDPVLAPLGDYGGPTQTMALLPGSPAIGAGTAVAGITTDQRGEPLDSPPDIGAFQSQGFTLTPVAGGTPQQTTDGTAFANPLAFTVTANNRSSRSPAASSPSRHRHRAPRRPSRAAPPPSAPTARPRSSPRDNSIAGSYIVSAGSREWRRSHSA